MELLIWISIILASYLGLGFLFLIFYPVVGNILAHLPFWLEEAIAIIFIPAMVFWDWVFQAFGK